ncbi:hypothetical protein DICVIV_02321 [Dictyocaulus viviparus]|uniref:Kinetochore protein NDC80 n=1 Tax=Dictyocaulus viviparus TaxID=29172 RepID=A0A0D8Y3N9_DICVI|nr:hypothetical protein DICVIV_02321 [Dictyocaulus viviparus]
MTSLFNSKFSDLQVPAIFRGLGYPTVIKPSTMQTIGASHSWPTLLGALTWLIGVVETYNSLQGQAGQNLLLGGDDSDGALKAYKYSWLNAGFKKFQENRSALNDENFFDAKVQALRAWYEQQEDFDAQQRAIQATLAQIAEECAELRVDKGKMENLRESIASLDGDIKKAECYNREVEEDVNRILEEYKTLEVEANAVAERTEQQRAKKKELEALIKDQEESKGLSDNDARALIAEFDQNKLTIRKLKSESEELCKQHWLAVPKSRNAFAEQKSRYHELVLNLKNLYSVINSQDVLVIEDNASNERDLYEAVSNIKFLIDDTEKKFLQRGLDLEQLVRQSTSEVEVVKQQCSVESGKLRERQRMESRNERQRRRDREEWDKDLIAMEACIDTLENEKEVLENKQHEIGSLKKEAREWMIRMMKDLIALGCKLDNSILED